MGIDTEYRQVCIIDAVSIVALCRIEIGLKRAIEWLLDDFAIRLWKAAWDEAQKHVPKLDDDEAKRLFFMTCPSYMYPGNLSEAIEFLDPHVKSYGRIGKGERECASLALEMSRLQTQYVILVTDDFKAHPVISPAFMEHQVGNVYSSYDLLTFIYTRHPRDITRVSYEYSIKDLTAILLERQPLDRETMLRPEQELIEYLERLKKGMYRLAS